MPSTIPYDPSLVLGSIVKQERIDKVIEISEAQAGATAARESLNSLLATKRSLDMTRTEILQLGIQGEVLKELDTQLGELDKEIGTAAAKYCEEKISAESKIKDLRKGMSNLHDEYESPVDYVKTQIKTMPLAADSMNMDVQYFAKDENNQDSESFANTIASFVSKTTSWLGRTVSAGVAGSAHQQAHHQASTHSITGTLVLSVSCTHKNAAIMAPLVLNVDKGVQVWNRFFPDDKLKPTDGKSMLELANQDDPSLGPDGKERRFSIISGMTFGSSFVGMVHVLNTTDTTVNERMTSFAASLQAQMDMGAWFEKASGGFGVNATFANSVKNLLSTQNVSSHVTLICSGVIPSMVAGEVKLGVETFAKFDPESSMQAIATIQNATTAEQGTVTQSAEAARTGNQMVSMKSAEIKSALTALAEIADGANKVLDVNSMMTALDDYLKKAAEGNSGVPINFYVKDITKSMLAQVWVAKYFPERSMQVEWDNAEAAGGSGGGSGGGDSSS